MFITCFDWFICPKDVFSVKFLNGAFCYLIDGLFIYGFRCFRWAILFSHPADYTPVCTTELATAQKLFPEFEKRGVKMVALSCDDAESHHGWICDIKQYTSDSFSFPIISDFNREIALTLGMIDPDEKDSTGMALTARCVSYILNIHNFNACMYVGGGRMCVCL